MRRLLTSILLLLAALTALSSAAFAEEVAPVAAPAHIAVVVSDTGTGQKQPAQDDAVVCHVHCTCAIGVAVDAAVITHSVDKIGYGRAAAVRLTSRELAPPSDPPSA